MKATETGKDSVPVGTLLPILVGLLCLTAAVAGIIYRSVRDRVYYETWRNYEDCGIS